MKIRILEVLKHLLRSKHKVYLDHNATTYVSKSVRIKMNQVLKQTYGNPSALYDIGRKSAEILEEARQQVADAIYADPEEICFTGCATESNNAVLKMLSAHFYPEKKKIISTPIEHPSVINTLEYLSNQGIEVAYCPVDNFGRVIHAELEKLIDEDTFLICCMLANNEIGTIQDIRAISDMALKYDILVMSDCVQALGKISVNVRELGVDYATFSAHKLYGPKGVGALYIKQGSPYLPFIHGGHQENGLRAGTESIHNISGFGKACEEIEKRLTETRFIKERKEQLVEGLQNICPDCIINSPVENCIENTISIRFPGVNNNGLMALLDYHGVAVSGGSACSANEDKPSHVLTAIGLTEKEADETIRVSLGSETSLKEIKYTLNVFKKCIKDRSLLLNMVTSEQLDKQMLFDEDIFILDVRPQFLRRSLKSLPNSNEISFFSIDKYLDILPREKHILVVCQEGNLSYIAAHHLNNSGFKTVSSLMEGVVGWRKTNYDLYREYAGFNVTTLKMPR